MKAWCPIGCVIGMVAAVIGASDAYAADKPVTWITASCDDRVILPDPSAADRAPDDYVKKQRPITPVPKTPEQWNALVEWCLDDTRFGTISERLVREAVAVNRRAYRGRGPGVDRAEANLAQTLLINEGKFVEAGALLQGIVSRRGSAASQAMIDLARIEAAQGRESIAAERYEAAVRALTARLGSGDPLTLTARIGVAESYRRLGRIDEAEAIYRDCLSIWLGRSYPQNRAYFEMMGGVTRILIARERLAEAVALFEPVLRANPEKDRPSFRDRRDRNTLMFVQIDVAGALYAMGDRKRARTLLTEAQEWLDSAGAGFEMTEVLAGVVLNARLSLDEGKLDDAREAIATAKAAAADLRGAGGITELDLELEAMAQEIAIAERRLISADRGLAAVLAASNRLRGLAHPGSLDIARRLTLLRLHSMQSRRAVLPAVQLLQAARDRTRAAKQNSARLSRDARDLRLFVRAAWRGSLWR
ncbi:tetratricopeptide repeat protein [Sphingomonas sp. MG17]|uniref:Tetratricopeptide repeat protein n=1 Tax=Sphingomonas tagetis TaxID=2949092 RepID=A0A9X2HTD5_9SPHN|nr:tetratricopeptide repeat protein [Sphingomonas tagetis]MCP3733159.1 tetratricopeptide repeat protein [Sphingomonas tagetis]